MQPTRTYDETLFDNEGDFEHAFFKQFSLRHAPRPLQLDDKISKNYRFPTFYGDVLCAVSIFMCDYDAAAAIMPDPRMKPVRMTRGRSLVTFSSYIYRNVMNVPPYNEIAMTIPVMVDSGFRPPVLPMIMNTFKGFGFYVFGMPVTSLENRIRGNKIWGLPKTVNRIDIDVEGDDCVTTAYEESDDNKPYLKLVTPTGGSPTDFTVKANLYSKLDGTLLQAETNFAGTFNVTKHMGQLFKRGATPDRSYIEIGDGPSAEILRSLKIESHPFQFRFTPSMNACFDLPNPDFK